MRPTSPTASSLPPDSVSPWSARRQNVLSSLPAYTAMAPHMRWSWGGTFMPGAHTVLMTVISGVDRIGANSALVHGSASARSPGRSSARCRTSRTASCGVSSRIAVVRSSRSASRSTTKPYAPGVDTRGRILDAALASFADRGYEATSLDALAAGLGVRKQTILYHFGTKDALLDAVVDRSAAELSDALERALAKAGPGFLRVE